MPNPTNKTPSCAIFFVQTIKKSLKQSLGVTLVELLVVLSVMATLTAVLLTTLNVQTHRKNTLDALIRSNMQRLVEGVETYRTAEGQYPSSTADPVLPSYIDDGWISDRPAGTTYLYAVNATRSEAGIMVTLNSGRKLKYRTAWSQIKECAATAVISDDSCP